MPSTSWQAHACKPKGRREHRAPPSVYRLSNRGPRARSRAWSNTHAVCLALANVYQGFCGGSQTRSRARSNTHAVWLYLPSSDQIADRGSRIGAFLVLVWAPSARNGPFFSLPGRGGCLGEQTTKWGARGRPAGYMAVPLAVSCWRFPLAGARAAFYSRGVHQWLM
jgi:hypothetical protein